MADKIITIYSYVALKQHTIYRTEHRRIELGI